MMSIKYESTLLCLVLLMCAGINALEYSNFSAGLSEIPGDIPLTVTEIDLYGNELTTIEDNEFTKYTQLSVLWLGWNNIRSISSAAFVNTQIKELYLVVNKLEAVPDLCVLSQTLEELYLGSNKIRTVDPSMINCLTNIKILDLSSNPFIRLYEDTITGLELLDYLDLSSTGISSTPVLTNLHLTYLDIHNTGITTFLDPVLSNSQIDIIYVEGTNLVCNCSIAWMVMFKIRGWPSEVNIEDQPCKTPSAFVGVTWTELTISDLCTGDIRLWEITYKEGPSVIIIFEPQDSTVTSPADHYVLQYSNVNKTNWINGKTVPSTGDDGEFLAVSQDNLDSGTWYMLRVIPILASPGGETDIFVKLWDVFNGTGPHVTIKFQTWDSRMRETIPLDHYVVQYRTHGDKDWRNGTTVTSTGEEDQFLAVIQNYLEPGTLYMLRVIPVISVASTNQQEGQTSSALIGGVVGGVLFLLVVLLLTIAVIYIRRKEDRHTYDDTEPRAFPGPMEKSDGRTQSSGPTETHHRNVVYENQDAIDSAGYEPTRTVVVTVREQQENVYEELQE